MVYSLAVRRYGASEYWSVNGRCKENPDVFKQPLLPGFVNAASYNGREGSGKRSISETGTKPSLMALHRQASISALQKMLETREFSSGTLSGSKHKMLSRFASR